MSRPSEFILTKKEQAQIKKMYKHETTDARKISEALSLKRHHVMLFLECEGLTRYSAGSYT